MKLSRWFICALLFFFAAEGCGRDGAEVKAKESSAPAVLISQEKTKPGRLAEDGRIIGGPYPSKSDLKILKEAGVGVVVCLLDPKLPSEKKLIDQEARAAEYLGLKFINVPLQSARANAREKAYQPRIAAAANTVKSQTEKVYFHCYLGVHRAGAVRDALVRGGEHVGRFVNGERQRDASLIERAEEAFDKGKYSRSLDYLRMTSHLDHRAQLVRAWATYRDGNAKQAATYFSEILALVPESNDAATGLGYAALRLGDDKLAETSFHNVLERDPESSDAHFGLALLRNKQQRYEPAERHLKACLEHNPSNSEAQKLLKSVQKEIKVVKTSAKAR